MNASALVKSIFADIDGSGGGQAFFATAGGKNEAGIDVAVEKIKQAITA